MGRSKQNKKNRRTRFEESGFGRYKSITTTLVAYDTHGAVKLSGLKKSA